MKKKEELKQEPEKRGRPEKFVKLDATPEEVARAMFSAVKPPDPAKRIKTKEVE